jgi:membrane peptidoglycan carboxypeptidase
VRDKNFFSHSGVDYSAIPRVLGKFRLGALVARFIQQQDEVNSSALFPQGGSTITQQLVRGHFLKNLTAKENSSQLCRDGVLPRTLSHAIGPRSVNMLVRKVEEIRLSLWVEKEMEARFGSKRRAKEEILARYASFIYMGHGQYGFATAAEYYFGRPLATFTADDADKAALLAGIAKSPRHYAPSAKETERVLRRRNQTLALMAANGFISRARVSAAEQRPIEVVARPKDKMVKAPAVLGNVLQELKRRGDLSVEDLRQGRIQVYSTVDFRVQQIANAGTGARPRALRAATPECQRHHPGFRRRPEKP